MSTDAALAVRRLGWFAFALGLAAQVAQILTFRELLAVLHGSELLFGLTLACGLAWTALGGVVSGWFSGTPPRERSLPKSLIPSCVVWGLTLGTQLLLLRWWAGTERFVGGTGVQEMLPGVVLFTAPAALLSGFQFVLALRWLPVDSFGRLYRAESLGAVFGGLLFTFVLAGCCAPLLCASLMAVALTVAGAWCLGVVSRSMRMWLTIAAVLYALLAAFAPGQDARSRAALWERRLPGFRVNETVETPYGRLTLLASGKQISIYQDASLVASIESGARVVETRAVADLCACLQPAPTRALVIGDTLSGLPIELLRHGIKHVDAVETDPALYDLARRYGLLTERPGVEYHGVDGRHFIKQSAAGLYDLLIVTPGLPDSGTANRFCTLEFFVAARHVLASGGVMVLRLPSYGAAAEYRGGALLRRTASVWAAMRSVFPAVRAAPVEGHLLAGSCTADAFTFLPRELGERLDSRTEARPRLRVPEAEGAIPVAGKEYFEALFGGVLSVQPSLDGEDRQEGIAGFEEALKGCSVAANRDGRPVAVAESLATGQEVASGGASWSAVVRASAPLTMGLVLATLCVPVLLRAIRRRSTGRTGWLCCAAATGLFGMAVELLLLHTYQSIRGYVYGEVGLLIACFMGGLALGAHVGTRRVVCCNGAPERARHLVIRCLLGGVLLCLLLPCGIGWIGQLPGSVAACCFMLLMVLAGFLDGFTFPPLVTMAAMAEKRFGGWAYAADLAGAGVGAVLCGAVWLPACGLWGTASVTAACLILAGLGLTAEKPEKEMP